MAKRVLSLETLKELDLGLAAALFDQHMKRVIEDIRDRISDSGKRSVSLTFNLTPITVCNNGTVYLDGVSAEIEAESKVPTMRTRPYQLAIERDGKLLFDDVSSEDVRQETMEFDPPEKKPEA